MHNYLLYAYLWIVFTVGVGLYFVPNIAFNSFNSYFASNGIPIVLPIPLGTYWAFVYSSVLGAVLLPPYVFTARHASEGAS